MARFYLYVVLQDGVLWCLASRNSEQLWVPTILGRRGAIGPRLGYVLEHTERCSTLFFWPDWTLSSWRKSQRKIGALGHYFWICRCRNQVQGHRDRGKIVKRCLDAIHPLGTARFWQLLAFQREFLSCPASLIVGNLGAHRSRKKWSDLSEIRVCFRAHRTLLNAVFMTRLDHLLMEKMLAENWRSGAVFLDL